MGCIASKQAVSITPALDHSVAVAGINNGYRVNDFNDHREVRKRNGGADNVRRKQNKAYSSYNDVGGRELNYYSDTLSLRFGGNNFNKCGEGEQVAAGWPPWLSAVAGEAIQGWVPLRADSFEKLEKIGQGTYSNVYRARDLENGKIVALKKVRFDNFEPESVRFMAREIMILRKLDHPNIVKLEGLITSRLSCSIYLVFEYMEHDLAGLSSSPDIKFSESQVKCYMEQLLFGLEHCHSKGVMHRDIKGSNLLINNEGILKIADFGLANFVSSGHRQQLTSRVVTLWYRPPELLLGSTDYGASVDMWSVGCVFAELFLGKPLLQGRTEVEQLHKIFKLCGSPPDDYWKKSKLPHATIFKPQHVYESSLHDTFKDVPTTALNLIQSFLSVEPYKRGTASFGLTSEYFTTKPYACDPSTLPKYAPNKEIDAKSREEARRKKAGVRARGSDVIRRPVRSSKLTREQNRYGKSVAPEENLQTNTDRILKNNGSNIQEPGENGDAKLSEKPPKTLVDSSEEMSHTRYASQGDIPYSGPLHTTSSSGFSWAKRRREDADSVKSHSRSSSRGQVSTALDAPSIRHSRNSSEKSQENEGVLREIHSGSHDKDSHESAKSRGQCNNYGRPDSFNASNVYHSHQFSTAKYKKDEMATRRYNMGYGDEEERVDFSGPILSQKPHKLDELLERHERQIRQAVRKSLILRGNKKDP